jgi:hypothetical protein
VTGAPRKPEIDQVRRQIGRQPRGTWSVTARCAWGHPTVIAVAPTLDDGEPFPTTLWLTCPWLRRGIDLSESEGSPARWTARVARDADLAERVLAFDKEYRALRSALGGGSDPCAEVGVAGQADPLAVKCLHARVAAALAGLSDPVGRGALRELSGSGAPAECPDDLCGAWTLDGGPVG